MYFLSSSSLGKRRQGTGREFFSFRENSQMFLLKSAKIEKKNKFPKNAKIKKNRIKNLGSCQLIYGIPCPSRWVHQTPSTIRRFGSPPFTIRQPTTPLRLRQSNAAAAVVVADWRHHHCFLCASSMKIWVCLKFKQWCKKLCIPIF